MSASYGRSTTLPLGTDSHLLLLGGIRLVDALLVLLGGIAAYWLRHDTLDLPYWYKLAIVVGTLLSANAFHFMDIYHWRLIDRLPRTLLRTAAAWSAVLGVLIVLSYIAGVSNWFSRAWVAYWTVLTIAGVALVRLAASVLVRRWRAAGELRVRVAVYGGREFGHDVIRRLIAVPSQELEIVGIWDDGPDLPHQLETIPLRGGIEDLVALGRRERIDEVVLAMVGRSEAEVEHVVARLNTLAVNVKLCAQAVRFNLPVRGYTGFAGLPLLHVLERPLSGWGRFLKALEDRVLGLIILILLAPVMLGCAVAVKLSSPGPVLFRQRRYGFNNNEITVYKFRSMRVEPEPDPEVRQATRDDPRITRVGRILRKTSLDELPQLLNVLRGEMSLVGPRPHAVAHNEKYAKIIDGYLGRHRVKPGITGWAQVNGYRGETDTPDKMAMRVQYDLYYIDNWSLLFDLKILVMTGVYGFVNRNAY